jgi:hypothetical protein
MWRKRSNYGCQSWEKVSNWYLPPLYEIEIGTDLAQIVDESGIYV